MAVPYSNTKRDDENNSGLDIPSYGGTAAGSRPVASGPKVFHSPVQPGLAQRPQPAPGSIARGAFDAVAAVADASQAPARGALDLTNRVAMGVRNFVRQGVGEQPLAPAEFNYHPTRDALADVRAGNARPAVAARPQPATPAAPVSTGASAAPVRPTPVTSVAPAVQATAPGGAAPAGGGSTSTPAAPAADTSKVLGTFNGRQITQADSDALSAKLPIAGGPVVAGPNGSYVASSSGPAASTPATTNAGAPPAYGFSAPRPDSTRIRMADEARAKQISALQDQLRNIGPLNMRSKRDLAATLQAQITQLTGGQAELAESGSNNVLDASTRLQTQGMGDATQLAAAAAAQAGENARAAAAQRGETSRNAYNQYGETYRNERNVQATLATRPVAAETAAQKLQTELATSAQKFLEQVTPANKDGTYSPEQIAQAQASAQQLYAQQEAPPAPGAQKAPDGNWYITNPDGSYSRVTP